VGHRRWNLCAPSCLLQSEGQHIRSAEKIRHSTFLMVVLQTCLSQRKNNNNEDMWTCGHAEKLVRSGVTVNNP
jgi:hypothetical protein